MICPNCQSDAYKMTAIIEGEITECTDCIEKGEIQIHKSFTRKEFKCPLCGHEDEEYNEDVL